MSKKTSIILSGVGGQGIITAATLLGKAAMKAGVMVYVSEVHGMAQRGGSVLCTVRMGDVSGALVPSGTADAILSMEPSETLRYLHYAHKKTKVITDITPLIPFTVSVGMDTYPDLKEVYHDIKRHAELYTLDAGAIAKDAGALITKNTVMLGALAAAGVLPFTSEILLQTILENIPKKFEEMNKRAFEGGVHALRHE